MNYEEEIRELKKTIRQLENKIEILEKRSSLEESKTHCGVCNTKFTGYRCSCNIIHFDKPCHLNNSHGYPCGREVCKYCSKKEYNGWCPYCYLLNIRPI